MSYYDEKLDDNSTETKMPTPTEPNNIVRVDFSAAGRRRLERDRLTSPPPLPPTPPPAPPEPSMPWWADLDLRSPWVLRLLAVVFLLILSMLIL